ncbi:MAG TPA: hypothetical protein VHM20_06445, partial [Gammaproteobacteria bacterium]|nr:hypothetical protein [Gammaproteobacteria bacterium]
LIDATTKQLDKELTELIHVNKQHRLLEATNNKIALLNKKISDIREQLKDRKLEYETLLKEAQEEEKRLIGILNTDRAAYRSFSLEAQRERKRYLARLRRLKARIDDLKIPTPIKL